MRTTSKELPGDVRDLFASMAGYMLAELQGGGLHVVLADAPEQRHVGHKVRVVAGQNIGWWQDLYKDYRPARYKQRSKNTRRAYEPKLDRALFSRALDRITSGTDGGTKYEQLARETIHRHLVEGLYGQPVGLPPISCYDEPLPF